MVIAFDRTCRPGMGLIEGDAVPSWTSEPPRCKLPKPAQEIGPPNTKICHWYIKNACRIYLLLAVCTKSVFSVKRYITLRHTPVRLSHHAPAFAGDMKFLHFLSTAKPYGKGTSGNHPDSIISPRRTEGGCSTQIKVGLCYFCLFHR